MIECITCNKQKSHSEFYVDSRNKDGFCNECKDCKKKRSALWAKNNREKSNFGKDKWRKRNPKKYYEYRKTWILRNPEKARAYRIVFKALKMRKLLKPDNCSICMADGELHAHHEDYYKPLKVKWVCPRCHVNIHNERSITCQNLLKSEHYGQDVKEAKLS